MYDVAIVGGGPAGLATAYALKNSGKEVVLYEETSSFGGRAQTISLAGEPVNTGAMFIYRDTHSHQLATELGVELAPFVPETFGIHFDGKTVVSRDNDTLIRDLPMAHESKQALEDYITNAVSEYDANTIDGKLSDASSNLSSLSAGEQLTRLPADAASIIKSAIYGGSVASPDQLSAQYALRYFASYVAHEKNNRLVPLLGMQEIPNRLANSLTSTTLFQNTEVTRATLADNGRYWTLYTRFDGQESRVEARHVVMAIPAPRIESIVDLPTWKSNALSKVVTPGSTTLGLVIDQKHNGRDVKPGADVSENYNDWAFVATPGKLFDAIINPRPGRSDGILQLTCFGNSAGYISKAAHQDPDLCDVWLEEFLSVAPGLRGSVKEAFIQSWPHCFSLLTPERLAVIDELRHTVGETLHFAGDFCSDTAGTHGAYAEAERVAQTILSAQH